MPAVDPGSVTGEEYLQTPCWVISTVFRYGNSIKRVLRLTLGYSRITRSISWLVSPGHHQLWYWQQRIKQSVSYTRYILSATKDSSMLKSPSYTIFQDCTSQRESIMTMSMERKLLLYLAKIKSYLRCGNKEKNLEILDQWSTGIHPPQQKFERPAWPWPMTYWPENGTWHNVLSWVVFVPHMYIIHKIGNVTAK